jgi:Outer membrane protein beta-barrel family/CarboxypepD_reg-like domain
MSIGTVYKILLLNLIVFQQLVAQNDIDKKISGILTDSLTKGVLPNATVMFVRNDTLVTGVKSKVDGSFMIKHRAEGKYTVKIQYVGYNTKLVSVDFRNQDIDLGTINLTLSQIVLSEIKVVGKKPFIEFFDDRVSMNVSESITGVGGNVLDILKKAPYIMVDMNGGVTLKGKSNPQILIDGKPTNFAGDVGKLLESMPSGSIDKIEIITNPSAKYEAEGRGAGVINIKTLKGKAFGFNGSINGGIGMGEKYRYNAGIDLNYRSEKFNLFGNYNRTDFQQYTRFHLTTLINKLFIDEYANRNMHRFSNTFKVGLDYQIDKKNTLGLLVTGFDNVSYTSNFTDTRFMPTNSNVIDSSQITSADRKTNWNNIALNLNYIHNFSTTGKTLKVDVDYLRNNNLPNEDFAIKYLNAKNEPLRQPSYYRNNLPTNLSVASMSIDFENPLKDEKNLEIGLKSRITRLINDSKFDILSDNIWINDKRKSNLYEYQENVNAGYINYKTKLKDINVTIGLRAENTNLEGFSVTQNEKITRNYIQFFPNLSFQKVIDKNNTIGLSYQQSISRPSYEQFNPFVTYHTNYSNSKGNPTLTPAIDNTISLDYDYQKKLFVSLVYTSTKDFIGYIPRLNTDTKVMSYIYENFDNATYLYLDVIYNTNITKWWQTNSELALHYQGVKGVYENTIFAKSNPYLGFVYSNTFILGKGYTAELSGTYRSRWVQTIFYSRPTQNIDIGFSKTILNNQGTLKFNITDVFDQLNSINEIAIINHVIDRKIETRYVRLNFSYKFGNKNVKRSRNRQTGISSESSRIN